ncbi:MAG: 50S ribosomal protein L10 [Bdellovibrionaceae bacterium]|nr:50S ribosomal protein L10 [Pseudobdellovibrionaceae bacterium]
MAKEKKALEISAISKSLKEATATFLVDFKGMDVEQVTQLRKELSSCEGKLRVTKNTLARLALKEHKESAEILSADLVGTNAFVFAYDEVPAVAKAISKCSKSVEAFNLKKGVMEGQELSSAQIIQLGSLASKEELRAQLLSVFMAPATQFVRTINEVPSKLVRVLAAKKDSAA